MLWFIDRWLKKMLTHHLHQKREKHIQKAIQKYQIRYPDADSQTLAALRTKLETEITRVFAVADESIISTNLMRARITFWVSAIFSTMIVLALAHFPITASLIPFFVPLISSFVAWLTAVTTIPFIYNIRVKGAMNSGTELFEIEQKRLLARQTAELDSSNIPPLESTEPLTQPQYSIHSLATPQRRRFPLASQNITRFGSLWQPYSTAAMSLHHQPEEDPSTLKQKP